MEAELKQGSLGEYVVWNLFIKMKSVKDVWDVRDDNFFRSVDVDFLICDSQRQIRWMEVKTDTMAGRTGNIAYELLSSKTYNTLGCLEKTRAEMIAYYIPDRGRVLLLDTERLRQLAHSGRYDLRDMGDDARGYLIPIKDLGQACMRSYEV